MAGSHELLLFGQGNGLWKSGQRLIHPLKGWKYVAQRRKEAQDRAAFARLEWLALESLNNGIEKRQVPPMKPSRLRRSKLAVQCNGHLS
jgi:hypothetical protein